MALADGITIEEFELLPHPLAHNHELVDGQLMDVSGNNLIHNCLRDVCVFLLKSAVVPKLGVIVSEQEFDFDGNAHGPDVSFISAAKLPLREWRSRVQAIRPGLGYRDRLRK